MSERASGQLVIALGGLFSRKTLKWS